MRTIQTELIEKGLKQARRKEIDKGSASTSKQSKERLTRRFDSTFALLCRRIFTLFGEYCH